MKRTIFIKSLAFLSLFSCITSCSNGKATLLFEASKNFSISSGDLETENYQKLIAGAKSFSAKLSEELLKDYQDGTNLAFSPISIYLDLGLGARASAGNTQEQILNALNVDFETLNSGYKTLFCLLNDEYDEGKILTTNSVWLAQNQDLKFNEDTLKDLANDYYCYSYSADFANDNANANKAITNFIKEKTNGLLSPDLELSSETFFVLLNTLYLKDVWNILGRDLALYNGDIDFTNSDGSVASNKDFLLGNYETGLTYENDDFESFYAETLNGYELIFIKPKGDKRVEDVFIQENIEYLMDHDFALGALDNENLLEHKTRVIFPEFEAEFFKEIKDTLITDFGITDLFNYKCDLTPLIKTDVPHWCTDLIHATKLKVDRKGIEGAAISALVDAGTAYDPYEKVFHDFVVDRSFAYLIRRGRDKILFSGVIETL